MLDLAGGTSAEEVEQAVAEARHRGLVSDRDLVRQLDRNPGRRGVAVLLRLLGREKGPAFTRSAAERRLLRLVRSAYLPSPETNALVGGFEADFLWRDQRLVVEVDGYACHADRLAFERDRRRDAELVARGYRVTRVTWRQLVDEPAQVIRRIERALIDRGS